MSQLQQFNDEIERGVLSSGFSVSGVAFVEAEGHSYYSASLVSIDKNLPKISVSSARSKFQRISVTGFTFSKCEILTFISKNSLPKPSWRVQLKYLLS